MKIAYRLLPFLLAAILLLSACGGNGAINTSGQPSDAPGETSASDPTPSPDANFITYDVNGFFTLEVPKDLESKIGGLHDSAYVYSPDGTWFMYFNSKEGGVAEYEAQKYLNQNQDTFATITVGEQEGFWVYNTMRAEVFIYFPFGLIQLGDELQSSAEKRIAYLDDPIVQNLLATVKLTDKANVTVEPFDAVAWQELFDSEIRAQNGKYQMPDEPLDEDGNLVYGLRFEDAPYGGGRVTVYQDGSGAAEYMIGFFAMEDPVTTSYASLALWCAGVKDTPLTAAIEMLHLYYYDLPGGETGTYETDGLKVTSQWGDFGLVIRFEPN